MFAFIQSAVAAVTSFSVTGFWSSIRNFLGFGETPEATAEEAVAADAEVVVVEEAVVAEEATTTADEPVETVSLWASIVAFFRNLFNFELADKAAEEASQEEAVEVVVETPVADEVVAA